MALPQKYLQKIFYNIIILDVYKSDVKKVRKIYYILNSLDQDFTQIIFLSSFSIASHINLGFDPYTWM